MRVLFAGTPRFAVPSLAALADRFEVCGVLTAPDRPAGRGRRLIPAPVRQEAARRGLPVIAPERLDDAALRRIAGLRADLLAVAACGVIFTQRFLDRFAGGAVNVHPSLLPRFRGAAPIPAAILAGDRQTGVTIQRVVRRVDAGPILGRRVHPLDGTETAGRLSEALAAAGAELLVEVLAGMTRGEVEETAQVEEQATRCAKVSAADGRIDWNRHDATAVERMVRAYDPWPRAYCRLDGRRLNLRAARPVSDRSDGPPGQIAGVDGDRGILIHTARGTLGVTELQLEGRRAIDWKSFANGYGGLAGVRLT